MYLLISVMEIVEKRCVVVDTNAELFVYCELKIVECHIIDGHTADKCVCPIGTIFRICNGACVQKLCNDDGFIVKLAFAYGFNDVMKPSFKIS